MSVISTSRVTSSSSLHARFTPPIDLYKTRFTSPIILSKCPPPHHGAWLRLNCQVIAGVQGSPASSHLMMAPNHLDAAMKLFLFSEYTFYGLPLLAMYRLKAFMNSSVVWLLNSSRLKLWSDYRQIIGYKLYHPSFCWFCIVLGQRSPYPALGKGLTSWPHGMFNWQISVWWTSKGLCLERLASQATIDDLLSQVPQSRYSIITCDKHHCETNPPCKLSICTSLTTLHSVVN